MKPPLGQDKNANFKNFRRQIVKFQGIFYICRLKKNIEF